MKLLIIICAIAVLAAIVGVVGSKLGWFRDEDNDLIPDAAEEAAEKVVTKAKSFKKQVKNRSKRVKEELKDVKEAAGDLAGQLGDVVEAAAGKSKARKGRKPAAKKPIKTGGSGGTSTGNKDGYYRGTRNSADNQEL